MRITVDLPDDLLAESKRYTADTGRTLARLTEDSLREAVARRQTPDRTEVVELPTFGGGRVMPGVDLDNSAALLDY